MAETNSVRAVDILTQRLPSVPDKPAADARPGGNRNPGETGDSTEDSAGGQKGTGNDEASSDLSASPTYCIGNWDVGG